MGPQIASPSTLKPSSLMLPPPTPPVEPWRLQPNLSTSLSPPFPGHQVEEDNKVNPSNPLWVPMTPPELYPEEAQMPRWQKHHPKT
eukprot:165802-Amphidinium_carterae.1